MRKAMGLAMLALAFAVSVCRANLGLTMAEIEKAFQKPLTATVKDGTGVATYEIGSQHLLVQYMDGVAITESLRPQKPGFRLSDSNCLSMAALFTGESVARWKLRPELADPTNTMWSVGKTFYAMRTRERGKADVLTVRYGDSDSELTPDLARCQVPLGKKKEDFEAKYGKPVDTRAKKELGGLACVYQVHGQQFIVGFRDGVAIVETIISADKDTRLSARTCVALARALTGATNWIPSKNPRDAVGGKKFWDAGKEFSAVRLPDQGSGDFLTVGNTRAMHELNAEPKAAPADTEASAAGK